MLIRCSINFMCQFFLDSSKILNTLEKCCQEILQSPALGQGTVAGNQNTSQPWRILGPKEEHHEVKSRNPD